MIVLRMYLFHFYVKDLKEVQEYHLKLYNLELMI